MRANELLTVIIREAEKQGLDWRELEVKTEFFDSAGGELWTSEDSREGWFLADVNDARIERDEKTQELVLVVR